jgi:uncharacterized membrane protein
MRSDLLDKKLKKENTVAKLIVVGFKKDMYRASEVLNQLQSMNDDWVVDLHDAVAVYRDYNGKLRVDQSYQMTRWVMNIEAGFSRSKGQGLLASCPIFTTTSRRDLRIQILAP